MPMAAGLRQVGYFDCAGGGQVVVTGGVAYIGHMRSPHGTSIVDVRDPKNLKLLGQLQMPPGTHSHKVRVHGDVMVINREINFNDPNKAALDYRGGLGIYDVSNPSAPRLIGNWETRRPGRSPVRFRRPLCLHLTDRRGICRPHRHDPRSERPAAAGGGWPVVDARSMDRGR